MQIALALLTIIGGILAGYITYRLNIMKELNFKRREEKEHRYKSAILHMAAYMEHDFEYTVSRPEVTSIKQLRSHLRAEYHQMTFYASRDVVIATRAFLKEPTQRAFTKVLLTMRRDLWVTKPDLTISEVELDAPK